MCKSPKGNLVLEGKCIIMRVRRFYSGKKSTDLNEGPLYWICLYSRCQHSILKDNIPFEAEEAVLSLEIH